MNPEFHKIEGWAFESEQKALYELARKLPNYSVIVEVGVWEGDFSQQALDGCDPETLYLVDPWEKNDDATNYTSTVTRTQEELDLICVSVEDRFSRDKRAVIVRATSEDAASQLNIAADWVYIDGIHTYQAVLSDLEYWWPVVKPGGMITGHDYDKPAVRLAILEWANYHGLQVATINENFLVTKLIL